MFLQSPGYHLNRTSRGQHPLELNPQSGVPQASLMIPWSLTHLDNISSNILEAGIDLLPDELGRRDVDVLYP
jgi:hypothetical protein